MIMAYRASDGDVRLAFRQTDMEPSAVTATGTLDDPAIADAIRQVYLT
jgi:hypothetical protein